MIANSNNIVIVDVQYSGNVATVAGVVIANWFEQFAIEEKVVSVDDVAPYVPGQFYKRELPCIVKCLENLASDYSCVVIDGYVQLSADQRPGLGMHLWRHLNECCPVVGVAKSEFNGTPADAHLIRGSSTKPLFISAVGMPLATARHLIASMAGDHRIPWAIKRADFLARSAVPSCRCG